MIRFFLFILFLETTIVTGQEEKAVKIATTQQAARGEERAIIGYEVVSAQNKTSTDTASQFTQPDQCLQQKKPNIIIVMTDDQGHDDIGFYNDNGILETPNMDKFARQSVQFDNFYTDCLCAPTRASLMTGRHHLKTGVWGVHGGMDYINLDEMLLPEALKKAGYTTAHFGKWHSGTTPGYNPWDRGFDLSYVTFLYAFLDNLVKKNGHDMQTYGWIEEWLADRIIEYLYERQRDGQPFFLYWAPMSIHKGRVYHWEAYEDFVAPDQYIKKYSDKVSGELVKVFAAIEFFDSVFGRVMDKVSDFGFDDNTVVMLFGDNGPLLWGTDHIYGAARAERVPSYMREEKGYVEENGIRNFFFVRGINQFQGNKVIETNVGIIDIFPSIMEMVGLPQSGGSSHKIDGVSFVPLLCQGQWKHADRTLYFHEILKNTIEPDQVLKLGRDRNVWKGQQMLDFQDGGLNQKGFYYHTALKFQDWKFLKGRLYQLKGTDHQEVGRNSVWNTDRVKATELNNKFYKNMQEWWQSILDDQGSFAKPIFLIGYKQLYLSIVRMNAPIQRIGSIAVKDQEIVGFKREGDAVIYRIFVHTSGVYRVTLSYGWSSYKGATITISIGSYQQIQEQTAQQLTKKIDHNGPMVFGQVSLNKTATGTHDELSLKMVSKEEDDWSEVFKWVSDIEFELIQKL